MSNAIFILCNMYVRCISMCIEYIECLHVGVKKVSKYCATQNDVIIF